MLFRSNSDFVGLIFQWLISAPRFYFAAERKELFLILVNYDQVAVVPGMAAYCLNGNVRIVFLLLKVHVHLKDAFDTTDLCSSNSCVQRRKKHASQL
jgi:hypothetical protein